MTQRKQAALKRKEKALHESVLDAAHELGRLRDLARAIPLVVDTPDGCSDEDTVLTGRDATCLRALGKTIEEGINKVQRNVIRMDPSVTRLTHPT